MLASPGLVLATAMAVSGTVIFLALRRERNFPPTHFLANQDSRPAAKPILRSCLCSGTISLLISLLNSFHLPQNSCKLRNNSCRRLHKFIFKRIVHKAPDKTTFILIENSSEPPINVIFLDLFIQDGKKRERKNKKRVQFAASVKDQTGDGEEYRKEHDKPPASGIQGSCRGEIGGSQANRVALYSGILRDRVQHLECSYWYIYCNNFGTYIFWVFLFFPGIVIVCQIVFLGLCLSVCLFVLFQTQQFLNWICFGFGWRSKGKCEKQGKYFCFPIKFVYSTRALCIFLFVTWLLYCVFVQDLDNLQSQKITRRKEKP